MTQATRLTYRQDIRACQVFINVQFTNAPLFKVLKCRIMRNATTFTHLRRFYQKTQPILHRESKKQDTKLLAITSLTIIRFSKFFQ